MRLLVVLVRCQALAALASFLVANAPAQQPPKLDLRVKEERPLAGYPFAVGIIGQLQCDSHGNVYFRPSGLSRALSAPIVKISSQGETKAVFSLKGVPGFEQASASIYDFAVGLRGEVDLLVSKCEDDESPKCQVDILTFREDGAYQSAIKLERNFFPSRLAVFPTGEQPSSETSTRAETSEEPYTAIFDSSGRVQAEVTLPIEAKPQEEGSPEKNNDSFRLAVEWGMVAIGEDGNAYLSHHTVKPIVHVISSKGMLLRQLQVTPPTEKAWPMTMRYTPEQRLIFAFAEKLEEGRYDTGNAIYSLVDAQTGERWVDYQSAPGIGGVFACYTPNGFTSLAGTREGHMVIRRTVPR